MYNQRQGFKTKRHQHNRVNIQYNFAHLFKLDCMCPVDFNMIEGAFKQSVIYAFNRNAITPTKMQIFVADYMQHPRRYMPRKVNARNFRGSCESEINLTLTLKRTKPCQLIPCRCLHYYFITSLLNFFLSSSTVCLNDFEYSCKHSETSNITNPIVKL